MGIIELFLIFVIVLLVFGAKRLPDLGRGIGKAIRGFRDGVDDRDKPS